LSSGPGLDTVNLFNGSLSMSVPLGVRYPVSEHLSYGFTLYYSSRVWDYELIENYNYCYLNDPDPPGFCTEAQLSKDFNAGPGWRISFGELKWSRRQIDGSSTDVWTYVAPDGSEHPFYETLHEGDGNQQAGYSYTRDNNYLRMTEQGTERMIEFPDGTRHFFRDFDPEAGQYGQDWRLWKMKDRWDNWVQIVYETTEGPPGDYIETWTIDDSHDRSHTLIFKFDDNSTGGSSVQSVIPGIGRKHLIAAHLAAPHGHTADYFFVYDSSMIPVTCKDDSTTTPLVLTDVSMLKRIVMPNGDGSDWPSGPASYCDTGPCEEFQVSSYTAGDFSPAWKCWGNTGQEHHGRPNEQPGVIKSLRLPTGGLTEWTYENWQFPTEAGQHQVILADATGVDKKTVYSDNDSFGAIWDYTPDPLVVPGDYLVVNKLTDPEGNDSQYYFRTKASQSGSDWSGWDFGLPFRADRSDPFGFGTKMSSQHYQGSVASGHLLRTNWVVYNRDVLPDLLIGYERLPQDWYNTNRRVRRRLTTHGSGTSTYTLTGLGDFDGIGHFRRRQKKGTLPTDDTTMIVVTSYNPEQYQYNVDAGNNTASGGFVPWNVGAPWILNTYEFIRPNRKTGANEVTKRLYCFDSDTGALERARILQAKSQALRADDIIVEFERDNLGMGNLIEERHYGADSQGLDDGDFCDPSFELPSVPVFQIGYEWQYGASKQSYFEDPYTGFNTGFYLQDSEIDPNTGLVTKETDTSGYWTETTYDALARPTEVETANAARIEFEYFPATGQPGESFIRRKVFTVTKDNADTTILGRTRTFFDGLGKIVKEKRLVANAQWVERQTQYTDSGRLDRVSTWGAVGSPTGWTAYENYDRWGRPELIIPPDGIEHPEHIVTLDYTDVSSVARTVNIGTSRHPTTGEVQETQSTTTEHYDSHGALRKVTEPSGAGGATQDWFYDYDVHGNLATVTGGVQTRTFTYDGLGFLRSEDIPEREGPITYEEYDPFGNVLAMTENESRSRGKTFVYDSMNRLLAVYSGGLLAKEYDYWPTTGGSGWNQGRLNSATRHIDPNGGDGRDIVRAFDYGGVGGNVSKVTTSFAPPNQPPYFSFVQDYTWDDLGNLKTLGYPRLDGVDQRVVTHTYDRGWLEGVSDDWGTTYISDIDYHMNGMVSFVTHGNGVGDQTLIAANGIARPTEINAALGGAYWTTGQIGYDGAGNITSMGSDSFIYDGVSRLKSSRQAYELESRTNDFVYDIYGNLTRETETITIIGRSPESTVTEFPAFAATNRLVGENYDYHGQQTSLFRDDVKTLVPCWNFHFEEITQIGDSNTGKWLYDADSERVAEDGRYFIRDLDGKVLAEFEWGTWKRDYIYRGSQMVAIQDSTDGLSHFHLDHLGSPRMVTDSAGFKIALHDYGPFGAEISNPYQDTITKKYTSHERDNPSVPGTKYDLDYMHARYYSPWQHRFLSVDPIGGDPRQPQSWNAFSYVLNNPINLVDPYGMVPYIPDLWFSFFGTFGGEIDVNAKEYRNRLRGGYLSNEVNGAFSLWESWKNRFDEGLSFDSPYLSATLVGSGAYRLQKYLGIANTARTAILAEIAVQAQIAAAGGAAEGIATGFATTGLTAGSVGFMVVGSLTAGVTLGNAARNHLIPGNANRWYGKKLLVASDFWGLTGGITRAQDLYYSVRN